MQRVPTQRNTGALDRLCLRAIGIYQRHISPRKGYGCAHARLRGGPGCSGFVRAAIAEVGVRAARPQIRVRFVECELASQTLRATRRARLRRLQTRAVQTESEMARQFGGRVL